MKPQTTFTLSLVLVLQTDFAQVIMCELVSGNHDMVDVKESGSPHMDIPVYVDASPSPGLHIGIAVFNILPTLCVTLGETDRLCAAQTSTAVGHSAPSLKFV